MPKITHLTREEGYTARAVIPLFFLLIAVAVFFAADFVSAEDKASDNPIPAPHVMTDEELEAFIKSYQDKVLDRDNEITVLKDIGLPTYNPQESLKTFCNREALKIDAVTSKGLYTLNEVPFYQCKAIADFYCFHKKPKQACIEREDGSVCEYPTEMDEDCDTFRDFIKKAYSQIELKKQHQRLMELVTQQPHD